MHEKRRRARRRAERRVFDGRGSFEIERQSARFKRRDSEIFNEPERLSAHRSHALGRNGIDAPFAVHLCI